MPSRKEVDRILGAVLQAHPLADALYFTCGKPPQARVDGRLIPITTDAALASLTPFQTEMLGLALIGAQRHQPLETLVREGAVDGSYILRDGRRFRVHVFRQDGEHTVVVRPMPQQTPTLGDLDLDGLFEELPKEQDGLILIGGDDAAATVAAVLHQINATRAEQILTIEDPVEYRHPHVQATVHQRELGSDCNSFHGGLRTALRQGAPVIMVGAVPDHETADLVLQAGCSGHLVIAAIGRTPDAYQTLDYLLSHFNDTELARAQRRMAACLRFVVAQRALPKQGGGRVISREIMGVDEQLRMSLATRGVHEENLNDAISAGRSLGWRNHDQSMAALCNKGLLSPGIAETYALNPTSMLKMIDQSKLGGGDDGELNLSLDTTAAEAKKLFQTAWPKAATNFPVQITYSTQARLVVYEPEVAIQGGGASLEFPLKVQGLITEIKVPNPSAKISGNCQVQAGGDTMIICKGWKITGIDFGSLEAPKPVLDKIAEMIQGEVPKEMELPNPKFTETKRKALQRLNEIGKSQHVQTLRQLAEKSSDDAEREAIEKTIQTIGSR